MKRFILVAAVVVHLSAAGLGPGEVYSMSKTLKHMDNSHAGFGKQSIVVTGNEERDIQNVAILTERGDATLRAAATARGNGTPKRTRPPQNAWAKFF